MSAEWPQEGLELLEVWCRPPPGRDLPPELASGLQLGRNQRVPLVRACWRRGATPLPSMSPVAWVSTDPRPLAIWLRLRGSTAVDTKAVVQLSLVIESAQGRSEQASREVEVPLYASKPAPLVRLELDAATLAADVIEATTASLEVRWGLTSGELNNSLPPIQVRLYRLLAAPLPPWAASPADNEREPPWTDALDLACAWADERKLDEVPGAIAAALSDLDPSTLRYSTAGSNFSTGGVNDPNLQVHLDRFIRRLRGEPVGTLDANCIDYAAVLRAFCALLGVRLDSGIIKGPGGVAFDVGRVVGAGWSSFRPMTRSGRLSFHAMGLFPRPLKGPEVHSRCADGSILFDGEGPPVAGPFAARRAAGQLTVGDYLERLAVGVHVQLLEPEAMSVRRRTELQLAAADEVIESREPGDSGAMALSDLVAQLRRGNKLTRGDLVAAAEDLGQQVGFAPEAASVDVRLSRRATDPIGASDFELLGASLPRAVRLPEPESKSLLQAVKDQLPEQVVPYPAPGADAQTAWGTDTGRTWVVPIGGDADGGVLMLSLRLERMPPEEALEAAGRLTRAVLDAVREAPVRLPA